MILANANDLAMIINYNRNHSFIVLAAVITMVNYSYKTFIVQATGVNCCYFFVKDIRICRRKKNIIKLNKSFLFNRQKTAFL
jgi:hypothetical protein